MTRPAHLPVTTVMVYAEELDLFGVDGCNLRVDVISDDGVRAVVQIEDCGVIGRQGQRCTVRSAALNGGRV